MVGAPAQFNTVLFGGFLGSVFSFLQVTKCLRFTTYVMTIDYSVPGKSNHWRPQWSLREKTSAVDVNSWYVLYYSIVTFTLNSLFFQVSHSLTCFGCSPPTSQYLSWLESWAESQKVGSNHNIKARLTSSAGNVSLSTAIVTDVSTPSTRGRGMAMIGVAFSLGFLIGGLVFLCQIPAHIVIIFLRTNDRGCLFALGERGWRRVVSSH